MILICWFCVLVVQVYLAWNMLLKPDYAAAYASLIAGVLIMTVLLTVLTAKWLRYTLLSLFVFLLVVSSGALGFYQGTIAVSNASDPESIPPSVLVSRTASSPGGIVFLKENNVRTQAEQVRKNEEACLLLILNGTTEGCQIAEGDKARLVKLSRQITQKNAEARAAQRKQEAAQIAEQNQVPLVQAPEADDGGVIETPVLPDEDPQAGPSAVVQTIPTEVPPEPQRVVPAIPTEVPPEPAADPLGSTVNGVGEPGAELDLFGGDLYGGTSE